MVDDSLIRILTDLQKGAKVSAMPNSRSRWRASPFRQVCIAFLVILTLAACSHPLPNYVSNYTPPPPAPRPLSIAIVGDAHTDGASKGTLTWPALTAEQLLKQNINVDPQIAAGSTPAGKGVQALTREIQQAVLPTTKLVVLFGSASDMESSPAELSTAMQLALKESENTAPQARILVVGPISFDNQAPQPLLDVRNTLQIEATVAGATFIDPIAERWFADGSGMTHNDHKTLDDAGHAYLAGKMAPLIAQQLQPFLAGPVNPPR